MKRLECDDQDVVIRCVDPVVVVDDLAVIDNNNITRGVFIIDDIISKAHTTAMRWGMGVKSIHVVRVVVCIIMIAYC